MRLEKIEWERAEALMADMVLEVKLLWLTLVCLRVHRVYILGGHEICGSNRPEITVFLGSEPPSNSDLKKLESLFKAEYENIYGLSLDGMGLEVVAWRVSSFIHQISVQL